MSNLKRLARFVKPHSTRMAGAVVAMGGVAAATFAVFWLFEPLLDRTLVQDADLAFVRMLAGVLVLLYLSLGIARYLSSYLMGSVGFAVVRDLRVEVYRHLQFLPLGFHNSRSIGGLMSRVTSDVLAIQEALTRVFVDLLRETLTLVALLGLMFWRDWLLALVVLAAAPLLVFVIDRLGKRLRRASREAQRGLGDLSALLQETLQGIRVVKAFGMEHAETEKFRRSSERLYRHSLHAERLAALGSPLMEFIGACAGAGVLLYGSWRISQGGLTLGQFGSFLLAAFGTYAPIRRLSTANVRVQAAAAAADRLFEILDAPIEPLLGSEDWDAQETSLIAPPGTEPMPPLVQGIKFENVGFSYDDGGPTRDVLHSVDLSVPAGSAVALVGESGAGKTTLANLIPRFHTPTSGRVCVDGVDLQDIRLVDLRSQISVVTQETILFNDSVRANIAYCQPGVTDAAVRTAAEAAFAHDFIEALPDGYDTVLGERGLRLSGGQRQRIAIARALLKNAPILILDEATSNLDVRSDRQVQSALVNLMEGRTTLIIAHRLSTIQNADLIVVIDGGAVVEQGTHDQLLARMGPYQRLYAMHFAASADAGFSLGN
ncbi:MAG: ATP-binding cassette domain-containing protein [Acidobacteria bacterium]|nr:ATP-binding cassette domain-containing protein [Acidobacteriota bacterium]